MIDLEKVIEGLECCKSDDCGKCPFLQNDKPDAEDCRKWLMEQACREAIALLKEQEPVEARKSHNIGVTWWYVCGNCNVDINPRDKFCHECGRPVKWE